MLLQSQNGVIHVLPALPQAWSKGSVKGLKARGNFEVDIEWEDGKLKKLEILSVDGNPAIIDYDWKRLEVNIKEGEKLIFGHDLNRMN